MNTALDCGVFCWKAEGIPAHRVKNIVTMGALVTRNDVTHRIIADVTHVDATRRVGKHLQHIGFRLVASFLGRFRPIKIGVFPGLAPFGFRGLRIIARWHGCPSPFSRVLNQIGSDLAELG